MFFQNLIKEWQNGRLCSVVQRIYQKFDICADWLLRHRISANMITLTGLGFAVLGLNFISLSQYFFALICLIFNRICDILDGQIARKTSITKFGAFLDIITDYTSTALFIWGFVLAAPQDNGAAGAFLLLTFVVSASAMLGFSTVSGLRYQYLNQSQIRICAWGILQNFDAFVALFFMCIFPAYFLILAIFFGLITLGKSLLIISGAYYTLVIAQKGKNNNENT